MRQKMTNFQFVLMSYNKKNVLGRKLCLSFDAYAEVKDALSEMMVNPRYG